VPLAPRERGEEPALSERSESKGGRRPGEGPARPRARRVSRLTRRVRHLTRRVRPLARRVSPLTRRVRPRAQRVRGLTRRVRLRAQRVRPFTRRARPRARRVTPLTRRVRPRAQRVCPLTRRVSRLAQRVRQLCTARTRARASSTWTLALRRGPARDSRTGWSGDAHRCASVVHDVVRRRAAVAEVSRSLCASRPRRSVGRAPTRGSRAHEVAVGPATTARGWDTRWSWVAQPLRECRAGHGRGSSSHCGHAAQGGVVTGAPLARGSHRARSSVAQRCGRVAQRVVVPPAAAAGESRTTLSSIAQPRARVAQPRARVAQSRVRRAPRQRDDVAPGALPVAEPVLSSNRVLRGLLELSSLLG
jgi:hypothetical protein